MSPNQAGCCPPAAPLERWSGRYAPTLYRRLATGPRAAASRLM